MAAIRRRGVFGRIINVDGFTIDAPDTEENQKKYPQYPAQAKGLGFPILRCVGLISMVTGLLIDLATAPYSRKGSGETTLLRQLKGSLRKGDLLVADSYYCTYWLIAMCKEIGVEVVMKNHHKRESHPIGAKQLSKSERITSWVRPPRPNWMTKKEYNKVPESISIRLCDQKIREAGSRYQSFTMATTMLDIEEHPAHWIRGLYRGRWLVEKDIQWIKCTMGLEHLRNQNPERIERELWAGLMTYNLVRVKMLQAGLTHTREARSLSFTETYQLLSTNWLLCACVGLSKPMKQASLLQSVCAVIGNRQDASSRAKTSAARRFSS
ncbi:IS4 family transposase [Novipirellula aureliae]|nr:IS4 family transposase [Novipirellula aureliae]